MENDGNGVITEEPIVEAMEAFSAAEKGIPRSVNFRKSSPRNVTKNRYSPDNVGISPKVKPCFEAIPAEIAKLHQEDYTPKSRKREQLLPPGTHNMLDMNYKR
ncbi:hypothetical protein JTB14_016718 [Gonioctena quinquepunctata]|nr:hypothetical protein JTB14_016718 [Gonioctena quinquepunctata]